MRPAGARTTCVGQTSVACQSKDSFCRYSAALMDRPLSTAKSVDEIAPQCVLRQQDCRTPTGDASRRSVFVPSRIAPIEQIGIPEDVPFDVDGSSRPLSSQAWQDTDKEPTDRLCFVPEMDNTSVRQETGAPPIAGVARIHIEPDRVDAQRSVRVGIEKRKACEGGPAASGVTVNSQEF